MKTELKSNLVFNTCSPAMGVPDANTIWNYDMALAEDKAGKKLFDSFFEELQSRGYIMREGSIVDATFIEAPTAFPL